MICNKYAHGLTVSELADESFLSLDSIKKIIYSKNNDNMLTYSLTLESAVKYANAGLIEEWIQCYLLLTRKANDTGENFAGEKNDHVSATPPLLIQRQRGEPYHK